MRNKLLKQIYDRLASLELEIKDVDPSDQRHLQISIEMDALRVKLQDIMNTQCPLVAGDEL